MLADVSTKLLQRFVDCLETDVLVRGDESPPRGQGFENAEASAESVRRVESAPAQPVDLVEAAGAPVAKRAAPIVAVLFLVVWLLRRRRKARG